MCTRAENTALHGDVAANVISTQNVHVLCKFK